MKFATTILLALSLAVGEVHTHWEKKPLKYENWIYRVDKTMTIQWNVKYVCMQVSSFFMALAIVFYRYSRVNKAAAVTYVVYQLADTFAYFYNYKTFGYGWVYIGIAAFGIIYYKWKYRQ